MSLAVQREKRANAGSKMAKLINEEEDEDDFYKTAYGGFDEVCYIYNQIK
jgi:vacuolar protein sorting-associated protein 72